MPFQRATRTQKKLRMALHGPSGSGKTFTALEIAKGLCSGNGAGASNGDRKAQIALIDTERGSASLYGDKFAFDTVELDYFSVDNYINAINEAAEAGYEVLVIDSLSHAWNGLGGVLDAVNNTKGNTFTDGWGKVGTPQQNRLMDAILKCPCHVIATLRVKTDYEVEKDDRGKSVPKKIGLAPIQRDGVEYEFDIVGSMNLENTLTIEKSRMIDLSGKIIAKPDRKLGAHVLAWLDSGEPQQAHVNFEDAPVFRKILDEEMQRMRVWRSKAAQGNLDMAKERAGIIECYKAVKGVAVSIDLQQALTKHPATSAMSALQILEAAEGIASECDAALTEELQLQ
jgi:hypothetical protein